jgi:hypothetical protein
MKQPIEVVKFDAVVVDELDTLDAHTRQTLGHHRSDAPDSVRPPREFLLRSLTPSRDRSLELLAEWRWRQQFVMEGRFQAASANHANAFTPTTLIRSRSRLHP